MALLSAAVKAWIGREVHYPAAEELGRASIRYFARALDDDNPLYRDDAFAREQGYESLVAPPTLVVETCQYADRVPDENGYVGHHWDLPVTGCRMIRAGNAYEFIRPVLPSDRISVTWTLEDIVERTSSKGGGLLFVTSVARHYDGDGELLAVNRETLVYQPLEAGE